MSEQRSEEWFTERLGCVTSSTIADACSKGAKGAEASGRRNLRAKLVCEILSGKRAADEYVSWDMKRGEELEPDAVTEYELRQDLPPETVGFVPHPTIARAGASPDRLVGDDGILEIKCPRSANHLDYIVKGVPPTEHRKQMLWEMACTGRQWVDFMSYDPLCPPHLQVFIVRFQRDNVLIAALEDEVRQFNKEVDELIAHLPKEE